jgi:hypothetical protein
MDVQRIIQSFNGCEGAVQIQIAIVERVASTTSTATDLRWLE